MTPDPSQAYTAAAGPDSYEDEPPLMEGWYISLIIIYNNHNSSSSLIFFNFSLQKWVVY